VFTMALPLEEASEGWRVRPIPETGSTSGLMG